MRFGYAIAALLLVGCGSAESRTSITVSAAASLTGAFTEIADEFAAAHPDVDVALNFGSSGQLAAQIGDGAPADVAAFADTAAMDTLAKAGLVDESDVFATNDPSGGGSHLPDITVVTPIFCDGALRFFNNHSELAASALANLSLEVLTTDGLSTPLTSLAVSDSSVDNVEHIYLQNLSPGRYAIAVNGSLGTQYALSFNFVPEVPAGLPVGILGLVGLGYLAWRRRGV